MGKIDTSGWKEFRVGDLFAAERGKVKNIQPLCPGETPIIAAGAYNQGIAGMYEIDSAYENRITISCNGAGCGSTFYHPYKFNVNGDAITLIEKNSMSDKAKSFIACILNGAFTRKYSYEEKCSPQKALDEIVRLPATPDGAPDWAYMESYMANLEAKVAESLTMLQAAKDAEKKKVDTREWGEFRVGELFDAALSKDDIQPKVIVEGNTPLVSSGKENNGIIALIDNKNARLWEANTLTVDMFGKVFYQEQPYYAVSHGRVNILMPRMPMTKHCMQFIGCAIERVTTDKYAFSEMCTGTKLLKDVILLPKDKTGQPDWAYMEEYMREIKERVKVMMGKYEMTVNEATL